MVEETLGSTSGRFTVVRVLFDVRNQPVIEANFARILGIKGWICVEEGTIN